MEGFNIRHCSLCDYCHPDEGGCKRHGYYMAYLLYDDSIDKFKESIMCKVFSADKRRFRLMLKNDTTPRIEWKL